MTPNTSINLFFNETYFCSRMLFIFQVNVKMMMFLCGKTNEYHSSLKSYTSVDLFRIGLAAVTSFSTADHSKFTWTESSTGSAKHSPLSWGSFGISSTATSSTNLWLQLVDRTLSEDKLFLYILDCQIPKWSRRCVLGKTYLLNHPLCLTTQSKRSLECI